MVKIPVTSHTKSVLLALLVTFLWSTSWVLIKIGLKDITPILFAGLRYWLAFLCLLPIAFLNKKKEKYQKLSSGDWGRIILLGFLFYGITQASQFLGLNYLPAVTVSVLLIFTSPLVALLGWIYLLERQSVINWFGILLCVLGAVIFFYPIDFPVNQLFGIFIVVIGVISNSLSAVLGRYINRSGTIDPLEVTVISMGFGSTILLIAGLGYQHELFLNIKSALIIVWLAIINTAFAFTIWNKTLQVLSAVESSIINGTMLIQIALLAWIFLDEAITLRQLIGMVILGFGAVLVQLKGKQSPKKFASM